MMKLLLKSLPHSVLDSVNAPSLAELDRRGLIVWSNKSRVLSPDEEHSAFALASRFTQVTPDNLREVLMTIARIYTSYGDCLALTYLMELSAEYFGLNHEELDTVCAEKSSY